MSSIESTGAPIVDTTVGPPNTADFGTDEKAAEFGNRRYWESYITYKTLNWDLEMGGGIGGGGMNEDPLTKWIIKFRRIEAALGVISNVHRLSNRSPI